MREIKFRAWDKINKEMVDLPFQFPLDFANFSILTHLPNRNAYDFEWLESTGLKDKNGKEIYEGDIVKPREKISPYDPANPTIVKFDKGMFTPFAQEGGLDGNYAWYAGESEIIGNIYEHPDILKK